MAVSNTMLEHQKHLFEAKVQEDLAAKRKDEDQKKLDAEKAAEAAREAVLALNLQEEIVVEAPAGGGANLHKQMSDGKLISIKRGAIKKKNERGERVNPDMVRSRSRVNQRALAERQYVRERARA